MKYRLVDLVDVEAFRSMLQSFYEATGILHRLVDADNNVISAAGCQAACTEFHCKHPISNERCLEGNRYLAEHLGPTGYAACSCKNGLMDFATAIVVEGQQLATLYFGQILHESPDMEFFRRQAKECGFDEQSYLDAIAKVPIISKDRIEPIMAFYGQLAQMLARAGLDRLRQRETEERLAELNRSLAQRVEERTAELAESTPQLQAILDASPVGIGWSDMAGKVRYVNKKFTELFGYRIEDIPTVEQWYKLAYPDEILRCAVVNNWVQEVEAARDAGTNPPPLEAPITCKDGSVRYVITTVSWVADRRLVNFSDITDRWLAEQRDMARNATLELIAKGASLKETLTVLARSVEAEDPTMICSILLLDRDGKHLRFGAAPSLPAFYNEAVDGIAIGDGVGSCGTAAYRSQRVVVADIQNHPYWIAFRELAGRADLRACWSEPIRSSKGRLLGTFAVYHRAPCSPSSTELQTVGYAANLASVAIEHYQVQDELEYQAHTDFLTELANRRHFIESAEPELARAQRYHRPVSLLMLDIDRFKSINDTYGHKVGDMVLKELAKVLRRTLREVDLISRVGGEEFAAILPETPAEEARQAAERLRTAIAASPIRLESGTALQVTASIGVSSVDEQSTDIDGLMRRADEALYAAKNGGRNRVCLAGAD